jgi:hypothetical protein
MKCYTVLATLLLVAADAPQQAREQADVRALQGFWVLKTTEYLGEKADQDPTEDPLRKLLDYRRATTAEEREVPVDYRQHRTTVEFNGGSFEFRQWIWPFNGEPGGVDSTVGEYKLDLRRNPPVMERHYEFRYGKHREERTVYCTYLVKGDTMLWCVSLTNNPKNLPAEFTTDKDEDVVLLTWKREKK